MGTWNIYFAAVGNVVAVWGIVWKMTSTAEKTGSDARQVIYKRFDEYKKHLEETHVSKEVCGILHNQIVEDVCEIKADVKKLLLMAKNGNK